MMISLFWRQQSHDAAHGGFHFDAAEREGANPNTLIADLVDFATQVLGMYQFLGEQLQVHDLVVLVWRKHLVPSLAILGLQFILGFSEAGRVPVANDGIHRMVRAAAIDTDPLDLHVQRPLVEAGAGPRVLHKIPQFIGLLLVPGVAVIASVDDEDIALLDLHIPRDHFRRIQIVVAYFFGDVGHNTGANPLFNGDMTNRSTAGVKMNLTVHVRADVVAGRDDLAVGALSHVRTGDALEILDPQWHVARPRRGVNAQRLRQVIHPDLVHELQELFGVHWLSLISWLIFWPTLRRLSGMARRARSTRRRQSGQRPVSCGRRRYR